MTAPNPGVFSVPPRSRNLLISSCLWILSLHRSRYLDWVALYSVITSTNLRDSVECWGHGEDAAWARNLTPVATEEEEEEEEEEGEGEGWWGGGIPAFSGCVGRLRSGSDLPPAQCSARWLQERTA